MQKRVSECKANSVIEESRSNVRDKENGAGVGRFFLLATKATQGLASGGRRLSLMIFLNLTHARLATPRANSGWGRELRETQARKKPSARLSEWVLESNASAYGTKQIWLFRTRGVLILPTQWMSLCRHESSSRRNPFLSAVHLELRHWVAILSVHLPPGSKCDVIARHPYQGSD